MEDGIPRKYRRQRLWRYQPLPEDFSPGDAESADFDVEVPAQSYSSEPSAADYEDDMPPWLPPLPRLGQVDVELVEEEEEGGGVAYAAAAADAGLPEAALSVADRSHPYRIAPATFEGEADVFVKLHRRRKPAPPPVASSTLPYFMEAYQKAKEQQPGPALAYRRFKETAARILSESIGDPLHLSTPRWPAPAGNPIAPSYPMHKSGAVFNGSYAAHAPELPRHLLGATADCPLLDVVASEMSGIPGIINERSPWMNGDMFDRFTRVKPPPPLHSADGPIVYGDPAYPTMAPGQSAGSVARSETTGKLILRVEDPVTLEPTWDIGNWGDWGQWIDPDDKKVLAKDVGQQLDPALVQTAAPMEVDDEVDLTSNAGPAPRIKLSFGGASSATSAPMVAQDSNGTKHVRPQITSAAAQGNDQQASNGLLTVSSAAANETPSESVSQAQEAPPVMSTSPATLASTLPPLSAPTPPTAPPRFKLKLVRKQTSTAPSEVKLDPQPLPQEQRTPVPGGNEGEEDPLRLRDGEFVKDEPMS